MEASNPTCFRVSGSSAVLPADDTDSVNRFGAKNRTSTSSEPFILISEAVHHWDENGLFANQTTADLPPPRIVHVQAELVRAVQSWMQEWELKCLNQNALS